MFEGIKVFFYTLFNPKELYKDIFSETTRLSIKIENNTREISEDLDSLDDRLMALEEKVKKIKTPVKRTTLRFKK